MAVSKANQRAVNKYVRANYDRINVTFPKGMKEQIKSIAESHDLSVNAYIVGLVLADMQLKEVGANE